MYFNDEYSHPSETVFYIEESIPIKDTEGEYDQEFAHKCECKDKCTMEMQCNCVTKLNTSYNLDPETNELVYLSESNHPIYECSSKCKCLPSCGNRLVQFGPRNGLKIVKISDEKQYGVITSIDIPKGGYVCEYAGEILSKLEAKKRQEFNQQKHHHMNYILTLNEFYGDQRIETIVDPTMFGNIGRYLNHCCEPNCILVPVRINKITPKIGIFAKHEILADSELTFDYGATSKQCLNAELKTCFCMSPNCKGTLPFSY